VYPFWRRGERGGAAAARTAAGGTDPCGPDGAASEGAPATEEGVEDRGEAADPWESQLMGNLPWGPDCRSSAPSSLQT
jgi:hypothetical protein